jgi:hypothetical protein
VTGWKWRAFVHPDEVDGFVANYRAGLANGEPVVFAKKTKE